MSTQEQCANAFRIWTAQIRKMLTEAGETNAAARVDNYSFETFHAGWHASRSAALNEAIGIVETYQVSVGNSAAGEIACEMTMANLREIRDAMRGLAKGENE